ncbi:MAG: site-specific integrase [Treponema sp.]|nr:site-specific integrase [Treponema sp.]MCL2272036.1 site-specific integrase [Treponema sp.]
MPKKNPESYCLFKKQTPSGKIWYVKIWDNVSCKYCVIKSTGIPVEGKRERRREAEDAAHELIINLNEKRKLSDVVNKPLIQFLLDFWTPDSEYIREKRMVEKKPLSMFYITSNQRNIKLHVESFPDFKGLNVGELTRAKVRAWKLWAAELGLSGRKINIVLQSMRVPVRNAYRDEKIPVDPFLNIGEAAHIKREKGVLTPLEVSSLIQNDVINPRWRLAVLLGCLCGMRRGEIRGLLWGDIGNGIVNVKHNFINGDGLKSPKCASTRTVFYPESVKIMLDAVRNISKNTSLENFIFEQLDNSEIPVGEQFFRHALERELSAIGIPGEWPRWNKNKAPEGYVNEQKRRNLTFHSLRHTYITLGRIAGITDIEIQALAGHKDARMMDNYTHAGQILDFTTAREKFEKVLENAG